MSEDRPQPAPKRLPLTEEQRLNWLMLIRSENVGPATFRDLINHFGSAAAALEALPDLARHGGVASKIRVASRGQAERELEAARLGGARFVGMGEPDYPPMLRGLDHPPPLLCIKGEAGAGARRTIAVVGSRNASITGLKLANRFAGELGRQGFAIVSGLARGVDTAAHQSSLESGTIAVFAGGLDRPFPDENAALAEAIVDQGGLLVSEMPWGWRPRGKDFPRRNRIIAGLALGVLVVEAAKRSGSLITARLAGEAGRLVFALPGSPLDPRSEGTNHLIKQGAMLVTDADDVVAAVTPVAAGLPQAPFDVGEDEESFDAGPQAHLSDPDIRERIIAGLGPSPIEIDDIIRYSGAKAAEVQLVLIELDLAGRLVRHGGNRVSLNV